MWVIEFVLCTGSFLTWDGKYYGRTNGVFEWTDDSDVKKFNTETEANDFIQKNVLRARAVPLALVQTLSKGDTPEDAYNRAMKGI